MKSLWRVEDVREFVKTRGRLPKHNATENVEKQLAKWINNIKDRKAGGRSPPLTKENVALLQTIPGWTFRRWERSATSNTRKGKNGWEAYIQFQGRQYYGPPRATRALARADYLKLRTEADLGSAAFHSALQHLRGQ